MATHWEGENLLVKLTGILRFCCEPTAPPPPSTTSTDVNSILPQGYHRGHVVEEPQVITDPNPWWQLLANHRQEAHRYTIIPTISIVPPWGGDDANDSVSDSRNLVEDQAFGESLQQVHYINPTPVLPHHYNAIPSSSRDNAAGVVVNATQRFYNALRVVLHGGASPEVPNFRGDSRDSVNAEVSGVAPRVFGDYDPLVTATQEQEAALMSPVLQVCAVLGILVVLMVILFHSHHFRRDCMTERRALRRVARRYHVARAQDDVERSEEEVTDVTL